MKKVIVAGLVVTALSTSTLIPQVARADDNTLQLRSLGIEESTGGLNTSFNSISELGKQIPLIKAYGLVILQQPNVVINSSLTNQQHNIKNRVRDWLDNYNPKLLELNENIRGFNITFNGYYHTIYDLATEINETEAKESLVEAFEELQGEAQLIHEDMVSRSRDYNRYKELLAQDSSNLSERVEQTIDRLQGSNGEVGHLRTEVKNILHDIQQELIKISNNPSEVTKQSLEISKLTTDIVTTGINDNTINYDAVGRIVNKISILSNNQIKESAIIIQNKINELKPLIQKLSEQEIKITNLTFIEDQVNGFTEMIERQATILGYVQDDWEGLNTTIGKILTNIQEDNTDAKTLQKQLENLKQLIDEINKQTRQFQDVVLNVNVN
jgi:non-hemolytic enterotoxin A